MFTILGKPGAVFGWFSVPSWGLTSPRYIVFGPFPFTIPAPDGKWYNCGDEYGVLQTTVDADFFDKTKGRELWKPALHGKSTGSVILKSVDSQLDFGPVKYVCTYSGSGTAFSAPTASYRAVYVNNYEQYLTRDLEQDPPKSILRRDNTLVRGVNPDPSVEQWLNPFAVPTGYGIEFDSVRVSKNTFSKKYVYETQEYMSGQRRASWHWPDLDRITGGHEANYSVTVKQICNFGNGIVQLRLGAFEMKGIYHTGFDQSGVPGYQTQRRIHDESVTQLRFIAAGATDTLSEVPVRFRMVCEGTEKFYSRELRRTIRTRVRTRALISIEDDIGTNNLENISGLKGAGQIIGTLVEGYKAVKNLNPRAALKFIADAYLIYLYAIKSTAKDVKVIAKRGPGIRERLYNQEAALSRRRFREKDLLVGEFMYCSDLKVDFSSAYLLTRNLDLESQVFYALDTLGLLPSAGNLWDLVPLSFVVDWFVGIGSVLDALRSERDVRHFTLNARVESQKYKAKFNDEFVEFVFGKGYKPLSTLDGFLYRRTVHRSWGRTDPWLLAEGSGIGLHQIVVGGALVLQRALK